MSNFSKVVGPKAHPHKASLYWGIFAALVFFTIVTVWVAKYDFGKLNIVVAMLIASTKACLVMGFFMHLAYDSKFFAVVASTSLVFLALLILFPIFDIESRADLDAEQINFLPRDESVYKYDLDHPDALPLRPGLTEPVKDKLIFSEPHRH